MNADGQIECVDVDECADHTHACSSIGQCENTEVMRFPTLSETIVEILLRIYQKKRYQKPNKVHMCALVPSIISAMDWIALTLMNASRKNTIVLLKVGSARYTVAQKPFDFDQP